MCKTQYFLQKLPKVRRWLGKGGGGNILWCFHPLRVHLPKQAIESLLLAYMGLQRIKLYIYFITT